MHGEERAFPGIVGAHGRGNEFPVPSNNDVEYVTTQPGITVRDYFAAAALQGLIACQVEMFESTCDANEDPAKDCIGRTPKIPSLVLAHNAFEIADAMIDVRADSDG
jgi:hypothetical protein